MAFERLGELAGRAKAIAWAKRGGTRADLHELGRKIALRKGPLMTAQRAVDELHDFFAAVQPLERQYWVQGRILGRLATT